MAASESDSYFEMLNESNMTNPIFRQRSAFVGLYIRYGQCICKVHAVFNQRPLLNSSDGRMDMNIAFFGGK